MKNTAVNIFYSLNKIEKEVDSLFHILLEPKKIKEAFGRRKRISSDTSANWWKRISVQVVNKGEKENAITLLTILRLYRWVRVKSKENYLAAHC